MTKYEKLLQEDADKKEKVLQILEILNGEKSDDAQEILTCAKFFMTGCSTFYAGMAKDWIESL